MNYKELLFDKDNVLTFYPRLAVILNKYTEMQAQKEPCKKKTPCASGLNKAIAINQLNYWLTVNEKAGKNFRDGYYWVYNSYTDWVERDFPFWSPDIVKRVFTTLESDGIVVSGNYNTLKLDKTKWYRIDATKLQEIINIVTENLENMPNRDFSPMDSAKISNHKAETANDSAEIADGKGNFHQPIPENNTDTNTDNNTIDYNTENTPKSFSKEKGLKSPHGDVYNACADNSIYHRKALKAKNLVEIENELPDRIATEARKWTDNDLLIDMAKECTRYFIECRRKRFTSPQIAYRNETIQEMAVAMFNDQIIPTENNFDVCYSPLICPEIGEDSYKEIVDRFFNTKFNLAYGECDYSLKFFLRDSVQAKLKAKSMNGGWYTCIPV